MLDVSWSGLTNSNVIIFLRLSKSISSLTSALIVLSTVDDRAFPIDVSRIWNSGIVCHYTSPQHRL